MTLHTRLNQVLVVLVVGLVVSLVSLALAISPASYADTPKPWCAYPDPIGVFALQNEIEARITHVHKWLPDVTVNPETVHLLVMSECER
ncbi:hypothetical protein [Amycolatopsis sp.]|jgi:hypothetical protein|uniref:hypothetical protein n=1 Tax=Amycolatopsis sp. TaxID=37632 RepID=UPI002DFFAE4E|nr:hypothetical protein [Amycolatopsis sp.]